MSDLLYTAVNITRFLCELLQSTGFLNVLTSSCYIAVYDTEVWLYLVIVNYGSGSLYPRVC